MKVKQVVYISLLSAILLISKEIINFIPNVELVSLLLLVYALVFPLKDSVLISLVFCFGQTTIYGFGEWTITYFVVWPSFVVVTYLLKKVLLKKIDYISIYSGIFGLLFGFFFAIPYFFILNFNGGVMYWIKGIPFDIIHGAGNYILALLLFKRLYEILERLYKKYG